MTDPPLRCAVHDAETRLTCAQCDTPICPQCMVRTDVGLRCRACAAPAAPTTGRRRRVGLTMGLAGFGLLVVVGVLLTVVLSDDGQQAVVAEQAVGAWAEAPALQQVRGETSAVGLSDGRVAVIGGGLGSKALTATEVFDPESGEWSATGSLAQSRRGHAAVRLDNGRVLVAGGIDQGEVLASAEVFDPATGQWQAAGTMSQARLGHTLTVLADGRVLATGGASGQRPQGAEDVQGRVLPTGTAEVFDPRSGQWTTLAGMVAPRFEHTATLLGDGRVLLAGGLSIAEGQVTPTESTELYDPAADTFSRTATMEVARSDHAAVALDDGRVLVAGGDLGDRVTGRAEVFKFRRGAWSGIASLTDGRRRHAATLLDDGSVLVSGGEVVQGGSRTSLGSAERYVAPDGEWRSAGDMACPRSRHGQARLPDGRVLAAGGDAVFPGEAPVVRSCADVYDPQG
jgi:N-acetylneuraminic acid mutarotase